MSKRKTTEEFIKEAVKIHGDKYDYSKVEYKNNRTKVCIICPEHGEFWQVPTLHIGQKCGCPKCWKKDTNGFIEEAKVIHGGKYDYSKVEYKGYDEPVCIICPEHGEFWQAPTVHLNGSGCPKCGLMRIKDKNTKSGDKFIEDAKKVHGDRYDYSKVEYVSNKTKVCIICPKHGEFWQKPSVHLKGGHCPKCQVEKRTSNKEIFVMKAKEVHGDKYDYSKVEYVNSHEKVCIICPKHGEFWQTPCNHLHGYGCPGCKKEKIGNLKRKTIEEFIKEANEKHNGKYSYENVDYKSTENHIIITCPIHGDFIQRAQDHLKGHGCPKCANQQSLAEEEIYKHISSIIGEKNVLRRVNNVFDDKKEIDIYVPSFNFGIEYNGLHWHTEEFGKDRFFHLKKTEEALSKGIKLIQIFEDEWEEKKDVVISKIDHILNIKKNYQKIFGRKCIIMPINKNDADVFLSKNHIQGFVGSSVYIGAYYKNSLIGVSSFTQEKPMQWNLTRMATDNEYICDGVCGKMLSYFKRNYAWNEIKTFADRRWTTQKENNLYTKLGFVLSDITKPDYRYVVGKKRVHKFNFRKKTLSRKYGLSAGLTEKEMTEQLSIHRIWDCGLYKYTMKNEI